jgi:hypothetical protein
VLVIFPIEPHKSSALEVPVRLRAAMAIVQRGFVCVGVGLDLDPYFYQSTSPPALPSWIHTDCHVDNRFFALFALSTHRLFRPFALFITQFSSAVCPGRRSCFHAQQQKPRFENIGSTRGNDIKSVQTSIKSMSDSRNTIPAHRRQAHSVAIR